MREIVRLPADGTSAATEGSGKFSRFPLYGQRGKSTCLRRDISDPVGFNKQRRISITMGITTGVHAVAIVAHSGQTPQYHPVRGRIPCKAARRDFVIGATRMFAMAEVAM